MIMLLMREICHINKGGRGRITSGSGRRVLEMLSIDSSCLKTFVVKEKSENRLLWAFYRLFQEIFTRSDGRARARSPRYFFYLLGFFCHLDPIEALYKFPDF